MWREPVAGGDDPGTGDTHLWALLARHPQAPNVAWSMDFVSDQTANGQRFRALSVTGWTIKWGPQRRMD